MKRCKICGEVSPPHNFYPRSAKCKRCYNRITVEYARNSAKHKATNRASHLRNVYGISSSDYDDMCSEQGGVCAICGCLPANKRLGVDHNHETGKVRGLLCGSCNRGLGCLGDDPTLLANALAYLLTTDETKSLEVVDSPSDTKGR